MKPAISTNIEQSRRLLSCGVDPKTADMVWLKFDDGFHLVVDTESDEDTPTEEIINVPAWSLSALLGLLPMSIRTGGIDCIFQLETSPDEDDSRKWGICYYEKELIISACYAEAPTPIEACVQMIERLAANGYSLNKIEE